MQSSMRSTAIVEHNKSIEDTIVGKFMEFMKTADFDGDQFVANAEQLKNQQQLEILNEQQKDLDQFIIQADRAKIAYNSL